MMPRRTFPCPPWRGSSGCERRGQGAGPAREVRCVSPASPYALSARPSPGSCRPRSTFDTRLALERPTAEGHSQHTAGELRTVCERGARKGGAWVAGWSSYTPPSPAGVVASPLVTVGGVRPAMRRWDACGAQAAGPLPQPSAAPQGPAARSGAVATERSCTVRTCPRCPRPCSALATVPWGRPVAWRTSAGRSPGVPAAVRAARICP